MSYEVGQLIDYKFKRTNGVHSGRIQYIDDEKIKLSGPPMKRGDWSSYINKQATKLKGSWYFLDEIEILSE